MKPYILKSVALSLVFTLCVLTLPHLYVIAESPKEGIVFTQTFASEKKVNIEEIVIEDESEVIDEPEYVNIDIPTYTYAKTYEDGGLITDTTSDAYKVISQCEIDNRGHYSYDGYLAVAMGNYFAPVGTKFRITLDSGKTFNVIKCDTKQDKHTYNRMIDGSGAIIEFIIDTRTASEYYGVGENGYILNGSFNNHSDFNGCVVKIEMIKELS